MFVDLATRPGSPAGVQPQEQPAAHAAAHTLRAEFVVAAEGVVRRRAAETVNPRLATGEVEVHVERLDVLNTAPVLPFQLDDEGVDETLRLHHRYLDLRRDSMRHNVRVRFALSRRSGGTSKSAGSGLEDADPLQVDAGGRASSSCRRPHTPAASTPFPSRRRPTNSST